MSDNNEKNRNDKKKIMNLKIFFQKEKDIVENT